MDHGELSLPKTEKHERIAEVSASLPFRFTVYFVLESKRLLQ